MVPRTFPSVYNTPNGSTSMVVYEITDLTGLTRWVDYIPVQYSADNSIPNSYDNNGALYVSALGSVSGLQAGKDYIRIYVDNAATKKWTISSDGYIPVFSYTDAANNNLELESGSNIDLESGDLILLEG
jgi:hypothetical protein